MPFELFVALRFLREGRVQTALILGGTTVGVAVIVFLGALISGLQGSLVDQTLSSQPHVVLRRPDRVVRILPAADGAAVAAHVEQVPERARSVEAWPDVLELVRATPGVTAAAPIASGAAFASRAEVSQPVALRGVEPESFDGVIHVRRRIVAGAFRLGGADVVIGTVLAADLGLDVGDKVRLTTAEGRTDVFTVTGLFDLGNKDVNERWVLVPLRAAQTLLDLQGGVTALEAQVEDPFQAKRAAAALAARTGLAGESWMETNAQLLTALRSQSASSTMIQTFVVIAVALGIASVLGVSVIQKSAEIGILKAVGTSTARVKRVFLITGAIVGALGAVLGGLLGTAMSLAFANLAKDPRGAPVFPVDLNPRLYVLGAVVAIGTGLAAAWLPARHAARLDPAVVIRHG